MIVQLRTCQLLTQSAYAMYSIVNQNKIKTKLKLKKQRKNNYTKEKNVSYKIMRMFRNL